MLRKSAPGVCGRPSDAGLLSSLMVAATCVFLDMGYELATMDAIARRACVSKVTIYRFFSGKPALFVACMRQEIDRVFAHAPQIDEANINLQRDLLSYGDFLFRMHASGEVRRLHRVLLGIVTEMPVLITYYEHNGLGRLIEPLEGFLRLLGRRGLLVSNDWQRSALQFYALFGGMPGAILRMHYAELPCQNSMTRQQDALDLFLSGHREKAL